MNMDYKHAGVDIDKAGELIKKIKTEVKDTYGSGVISEIGFFGGLFEIEKDKYRTPVLVSSIDGVGTKLKIAFASGIYNTVGRDLVNHCVNDIAVAGAVPLFFLDYYGTGSLDVAVASEVISGITQACKENSCALIGGETAEMPGFYAKKEFDLVGAIVGIVEKEKIIDGSKITEHDAVIGLESSGLHTNGYALARKILFENERMNMADIFPGSKEAVSDVLLKVHTSYLKAIGHIKEKYVLKGISHITGGGFIDNIPRILPEGLTAEIKTAAWPQMPVFSYLEKKGNINRNDMYRFFNMGIGMVFIVKCGDANDIVSDLKSIGYPAYEIGRITAGNKKVILG